MTSFESAANQRRKAIADLAADVHELHTFAIGGDEGEAHANIMLAYRHLEDARMRIGKAIQAAQGGTSIYDQQTPPGPQGPPVPPRDRVG